MKRLCWDHKLILIVFMTGELIFLAGCKKEENKTKIKYGTVIDIDGNSYKTVKIGNQWWMAENLKTTKLKDGTDISLVMGGQAWDDLFTPGYCHDYQNQAIFYNWYSVNTSKLCPTGWHVPDYSEWTTLITFLGGENVAGCKIKSVSSLWQSKNVCATNESGFTAEPYGIRIGGFDGIPGNFIGSGLVASFWTATEHSDLFTASDCSVEAGTTNLVHSRHQKDNGESLRCIKDQ